MVYVSKNQPITEALQMAIGAWNGDPEMKLKREQLDLERDRNDALIRQNNSDAALKEFDLENKQGLVGALSGAYNPTTGLIEITPENASKIAAFAQNPEYLFGGLKDGQDALGLNISRMAGRAVDEDSAFSIPGQQKIADRNAGYSQELKRMENANALTNTNLKSRNDLIAEQYAQQVRAAKFKREPVPPPPTFSEGLGSELNYDVPATGEQDLFGFAGYGGADPMLASQNAIAQRKQNFASGLPTPDMGLPPQGSALPWTAAPLPQAQGGIAAELMGPPAPAQTATAAPTSVAEALITPEQQMAQASQDYEYARSIGDVEMMDQALQAYNAFKNNQENTIVYGPDGKPIYQKGPNGKNLTEVQGKYALFASRAAQANDNLEKILESPYGQNYGALDMQNATDYIAGMAKTKSPTIQLIMNSAMSPEGKQMYQAQNSFLTAIVRPDSGAALVPDEWLTYGKVFLPMPGDDATTVAQKKADRQLATSALAALSNGGANTIANLMVSRGVPVPAELQSLLSAAPIPTQEGLGTQLQTNTTQDGWSIEVEQ